MEENGFQWDFQPFLSTNTWNILYQSGNGPQKIMGIISGFCRRFLLLFRLRPYDYVFIHREATPLGPPIVEYLISQVLGKKIIYDFDDAIWLSDQSGESWLWKTLKWRSKVSSICKWSWKVSTGNEFLADYAKRCCERVVILPTIVNTEIHQINNSPVKTVSPIPTIGWTGSHSTLSYLEEILPVLQEIEQKVDFKFIVIANRDPKLPLKNYQFIQWKKELEIDDLSQLDIGVMPLTDSEWSRGKCGFKLIQYLALGIPAIASPVGVNGEIVKHGETGFIATTPNEWKTTLMKLIESPDLRNSLGQNGRMLIINHFSVQSQKEVFFGLLSQH